MLSGRSVLCGRDCSSCKQNLHSSCCFRLHQYTRKVSTYPKQLRKCALNTPAHCVHPSSPAQSMTNFLVIEFSCQYSFKVPKPLSAVLLAITAHTCSDYTASLCSLCGDFAHLKANSVMVHKTKPPVTHTWLGH